MQKYQVPRYESLGDQLGLTYYSEDIPSDYLYLFPGGDTVTVKEVVCARVSRHGHHTLTTTHGVKHIIPFRWISLSIDGPEQCPEEYRQPKTE